MKRRNAFTLLELLVVIAIIGILISMGVVAFSTAQKKGRDARRRADMKAVQEAFEQYYGENGAYEACATMASVTYLPSGLPIDPKNIGGYTYTFNCSAASEEYCACANLLEDEGGGNANAPGASTTCAFAAGSDAYCVGNLQ